MINERKVEIQAVAPKEHVRSAVRFFGPVSRGEMLEGSYLPTMAKLAGPNALVLTMQALLNLSDIFFIGPLGAEAIAAVTIVSALNLLIAALANSGIGGGVASAMARAVGSGDAAQIGRLPAQAVYLAIAFGSAIAAGNYFFGPMLFRSLGAGTDGVMQLAIQYAGITITGAPLVWLSSLLAAAIRGSGNPHVSARAALSAALLTLPSSPILIYGVGPIPPLGLVGAGLSFIVYQCWLLIFLLRHLLPAQSFPKLVFAPFDLPSARSILRIGGWSMLSIVQSNATALVLTSVVSTFGYQAVAGYGIALRLDFILTPLIFGLGAAVQTLSSASLGAGNVLRARSVAWTGVLLATGITEVMGLALAASGPAVISFFSKDSQTIVQGGQYLQTAGPFYGFFGIALLGYYVGQAADRMAIPLLAGTSRLLIAALGGLVIVRFYNGTLQDLCWMIAAGHVAAGSVCLVLFATDWSRSSKPRWAKQAA
jgi:putative MATE family efflux protein